jgi:Tol biopolymer transport system component
MDKENKQDNSEDIVIDNDKLDINEQDEIISDDVLSDEQTNEDVDINAKVNAEDEVIDESKTVGEAIDESANEPITYQRDPEVDAAVDDIVRTESDESIAEADAKLAALEESKNKKTLKQKVKSLFSSWWDNKPVRNGTIAALFVVIVIISLLPASRYTVFNALGVRVTSSMTIVDSQTRLPLKNINVSLQDKTGVSDENGNISFDELKLGNSELLITKRGYADTKEEIVLGLGSNPIGEKSILATGEQFVFVLSDWQSDVPITDAEASSGENSAKADEKGKIILTIGEEDISNVEISISAQGYRTEVFESGELNQSETLVKLVPSKKHTFISNRDGKYDLYKIDIDGKNEELLLEATGNEREVPTVKVNPDNDTIALISSRSGETNRDGFILDGLYIVDVNEKTENRIARSEQLQVIGWSGDNLVYLQVVEGTSAGNDERSKLISYNNVTGERVDLAAANYFNDVKMVGNKVYYAVSSFAVPESQAKMYVIDVNGENLNKLIDTQVWNIFRTSYDTLLFSAAQQKWYQQVGEGLVEEIGQQASPISLNFVNSPDNSKTTWVEIRDGRGVLLMSSLNDEFSEEQILSEPGIYEVLYWSDNSTVVFRVIRSGETADYVVNVQAKMMQKITDITASRNTFF